MTKKRFGLLAAILCVGAMMMGMLSACAGSSQTPEEQAQAANRAYMASINKMSTELQTQLDGVVSAVASGDVVSLGAKTTDALAVLDELEKIEAPEALAEVHSHYVAGSKKLREALGSFVSLFANEPSISKAAFAEQLASVQKCYNEGIAELKLADTTAAGSGTENEKEEKVEA